MRQQWLWMRYLLAGGVSAVTCWGILLGYVFSLGALALVGLGMVPLLLVAIPAMRWLAGLRRNSAGQLLGTSIATPYRPVQGGALTRTRVVLTDPATWRDLAWVVLHGGYGALAAIAGVGLWASLGFGVTMPLWWVVIPGHLANSSFDGIPVHPLWGSLLAVPVGLLNGGVAWLLCRRMALAEARLARWLLAPTSQAELAQRVQQLAASRAETVDARAAELRRIERDLHDGAQARLVSLAISLGMAEESLPGDPQTTRELLAEARESARTALTELRDLVRGIHPPVLADRGLTGALQSLAIHSPVPVRLDLAPIGRAPAPVESALYFVAAEALANTAKHAAAHQITMTLTWTDGLLRLDVGDDGHGGALPCKGGGLAGIIQRVSAFDGHVTLHSPPGGPTLLRVELPCES